MSSPEIRPDNILHYDQKFILHLLQSHISFPISSFISSLFKGQPLPKLSFFSKPKPITLFLEKDLFEELSKQGELDKIKSEDKEFSIREKTKLEEVIEKDDIDTFRVLTSELKFNETNEKENLLFKFSKIPVLSYCIEQGAIKCFKYALINRADPTQRCQYIFFRNSNKKNLKLVY